MSGKDKNGSSQDRLVLLGTGTCQLQAERKASSVLVEQGGTRWVYDLGRGIADRLASIGLRQDDVRHIVFSHFHPDHVSDLAPYLHAAAWSQIDPRSVDLHLHGPPGLLELVTGIQQVFGVQALGRDDWQVHVHEIEENTFRIEDGVDAENGVNFEFIHLPPAGNRGLKWCHKGRHGEQVIALTGDSNFHDQEVRFLAGVDLAIFDSGHLTDDEIVSLAASANPGVLVCSHVYRPLDLARLQAEAEAEGFTGRFQMGEDLMEFPL